MACIIIEINPSRADLAPPCPAPPAPTAVRHAARWIKETMSSCCSRGRTDQTHGDDMLDELPARAQIKKDYYQARTRPRGTAFVYIYLQSYRT